MTSIAGLNNFNNLLYNTKKIAIANVLEHRAGRVPLDLSYNRDLIQLSTDPSAGRQIKTTGQVGGLSVPAI